jgi:hypothetical protein
MLLGTATWAEGPAERRALVARLESGRVADLNRIEAFRLRKLGEGDAERLAEALVPPSLRRVLEGGPRALARVRQTVAYAEKWDRRGTLPGPLAPTLAEVSLGPCLPRPVCLRRLDGTSLDRLALRGPGTRLMALPHPTLAVVGTTGGLPAGFCLALEEEGGTILGAWLTDGWPQGPLTFRVGGAHRSLPGRGFEGLELPSLRAGEALLLPPPRLKPFPDLLSGVEVRLSSDFDELACQVGSESLHPTLQ